MAQLNKETKQVTKQVTVDEQVVTGMTLDRKEAYILAVIGTMNKSNARVITRNMKGKLGEYGLTQQDLEDFLTKIEGPELVIPEGLPKVEPVGRIAHTTGVMPAGVAGKQVTAYLRGGPGCGWHGDTLPAEEWCWSIDGSQGDIVAYEVVEPKAPGKVPGKFTKGDRVVFNQDYKPKARKGDTGTVTFVTGEKDGPEALVSVELDKDDVTSTAFAYRLDHLKEQPKLRVGAKIRIVDPQATGGLYGKGDEFTVTGVSSTGGAFFTDIAQGRSYAYAREFEVIG